MLAVQVFTWLLVVVVCTCNLAHAQYITEYFPQPGDIVKSGDEAVLRCKSNLPWYLCVWEGPGGIACQCQLTGSGGSQLCSAYPQLSVTGSGFECVATLSGTTFQDAGDWKCVLIDQDQLSPASQLLQLEVGQAAVVTWVNIGGSVSLDEGASADWRCEATGGYPEPTLTVTGPGGINTGSQESNPSSSSPLVDTAVPVSYTGEGADDNSQIICVATQYSSTGAVLYESEASFNLNIAPGAGSASGLSVGDIIGIVFAILFFLLIVALLCCFCCCYSRGIAFFRRDSKDSRADNKFQNNIYIGKDGGFVHTGEKGHEVIIYKDDGYINNKDGAGAETEVLITKEYTKEVEEYEYGKDSVVVGAYIPVKKVESSSSSSSSSSSQSSVKGKHQEYDKNTALNNLIGGINEAGFHFAKETDHNVNIMVQETNVKNTNVTQKIEEDILVTTSNVREEISNASAYFPENTNTEFVCNHGIWKDHENKVNHGSDSFSTLDYSKQPEQVPPASPSINDIVGSLYKAEEYFSKQSTQINTQTSVEEQNSNVQTQETSSISKSTGDNNEEHFDKNKSKRRIKSLLKKDHDWKNNLSRITEERLSQLPSLEDVRKSLENLNTDGGQTQYMYTNVPTVLVSKIDTSNINPDKSVFGFQKSENDIPEEPAVKEDDNQDKVITNGSPKDDNIRRYNDEHYYIGSSEYAEVVEEHVNGKYEDDLGYYTEKTNEKITVNPKIWKVEEIIQMTENQSTYSASYINGRGRETPLNLPDTPQDDSFKHNYIQQWISTENVTEFSPGSNPDGSKAFNFPDDSSVITSLDKPKQESRASETTDIEELDKSDESCIVTSELRRKQSFDSTRSSNAFDHELEHFNNQSPAARITSEVGNIKHANIYQKNIFEHIADYHKTKRENLGTDDAVNMLQVVGVGDSVRENLYQNVRPRSQLSDYGQARSSRHSDGKTSTSGHQSAASETTREISRIGDKAESEAGDHDPSRVYRITQNEITLFSKNPRGKIKITHRPLVNTTLNTRIKSMPELQLSLDEPGSPEVEVADAADVDTSQHLHIPSVGLIQQSLSMRQFMSIGTTDSTGSIFDCDMKCFNTEQGY